MLSVSSIHVFGAGATHKVLHLWENSFVRKHEKYFKEIGCKDVGRVKLA
jgi:hypothetical protein